MIVFNKSKKGKRAKRQYIGLIDSGWSELGAIEMLIIWGYGKEFETDFLI